MYTGGHTFFLDIDIDIDFFCFKNNIILLMNQWYKWRLFLRLYVKDCSSRDNDEIDRKSVLALQKGSVEMSNNTVLKKDTII